MKRRKRSSLSLWLGIGSAVGLGTAWWLAGAPQAQSQSFDELAIAAAAAKTGKAKAELTIEGRAQASYPVTGARLHDFKVRARTGEVVEVSLDPDGKSVDGEAAFRAETEAAHARHGKLGPVLRTLLASENDAVPVVVAFTVTNKHALPERPGRDELRGSKESVRARIAAARQRRADAALAREREHATPLQRKLAAFDRGASWHAGAAAIHAKVTPSQAREIAQWPEVASIDVPSAVENELHRARRATQFDTVNDAYNLRGSGIQIAQIEHNNKVDLNHAYIRDASVTIGNPNACQPLTGHAMNVLGVMLCDDTTNRGMTIDATYYLGGGCNPDASELMTWSTNGKNWGADVFNLSWGDSTNSTLTLNNTDKFYDRMVFDDWRTVVKSAGNRREGLTRDGTACGQTDGRVTSPGLAYNVITVGGFDDNDTRTNWADDKIYACSSWANPTSGHNDRVKPELVAPAANVTTTSDFGGGFIATEGTSVAAPQVVSAVAVLIEREGWLASWPEVPKALLIATTRALNGNKRPPNADELVGYGRLDAKRAVNLVNYSNGSYLNATIGCTATATAPYTWTVSLTANRRYRFVVNYTSDPDYAEYATRPSADFDMTVTRNGTSLGGSSRWDATTEVVDVTPTVTGNHVLNVWAHRCSGDPTSYFVGLAYFDSDAD